MTTTDFAALAEQGVDAWNRWRAEHPDCAPDLSRAYLYGQVLSGFDLSNTDLSHACLIGADLQQANLSGACLESAYANSANFTETNLSGADLRQGSFNEADFTGANLSAVKAEASSFGGACFTGACLMGWQVDGNTSFVKAKGDYLYLGTGTSLRWPPIGEAKAGELAAFLQQRSQPRSRLVPAITKTITRTANTTAQILNNLRVELFAVGFDLKVLLALQIARLRYLLQQGWSQGVPAVKTLTQTLWVHSRAVAIYLGKGSQAAYRRWQTQLVPSTHRQTQYYWRLTQRNSRYWQIQSRRVTRRTHRQSTAWWQQFVLGESHFQRWVARSHQKLRTLFTYLSRRLRVFAIRCCQQTAASSIRNAKRLHRQIQQTRLWLQQFLAPRFLHLQQQWSEFTAGSSAWQKHLAQAQQRRRSHFNVVSQSIVVERKRQLKALQIAVSLGRRRARIIQWRSRRYTAARGGWWSLPGYFATLVVTRVSSACTIVSRRYPIPAALGSVAVVVLGIHFYRHQLPLPQATARLAPTAPSYLKPAVAQTPISTVKAVSNLTLPCPFTGLREIKAADGYTYEDGAVFYGERVNNQPADGTGTMIYATGNRYDGEYQNGQRSGCGTFTYSNGQRYIGQFAADEFNGQGTWILENGERYIGEFKGNECNGKGTFIFANGSANSGIWQDGQLENSELRCKFGSLRVPASSDN
ncbi:MAG: pentapeptide repeat-containing protein [Cyanobacteria bacterium J06559_1]